MIKYICLRCGFYIEALKGCEIKCPKCRRMMYADKGLKNEEILRQEMILCFEEQLRD